MPNWCHNSMVVVGPETQVRSIIKAAQSETGLTSLMPQPVDEAGEVIGGTSWQYDTWGTKWGDCDGDIVYEDYSNPEASAGISYSTAWGPMSGLIAEVSRQHPDVVIDIEYEEPGMCFFGVESYKAGEIVFQHHHEYNFDEGVIKLPDGWEMPFDTDYEDEEQDPVGTLHDAIYAAYEHLWQEQSLNRTTAPSDSPPVIS